MSNIKIYKRIFAIFAFTFIFLSTSVTYAEENKTRDYRYGSILVDYIVNKDTTVDVREIQEYVFSGEYHEGWRSLSKKGSSYIDNIYVQDADTGEYYHYVEGTLDKYSTSSWSNFTIKERPGYIDVIWYYNAKDQNRKWIIGYKLHGALSFLPWKDEFYWNSIEEYTKPIDRFISTVTVPENNYPTSSFSSWIYTSDANDPLTLIEQNKQGSFFTSNVSPYGKITIAYGWPKGIVDRGAFWREWLKTNRYYFYGLIQLIVILIILSTIWYFREKRREKFVIVPEYEPPHGISPAVADIILHEKITKRTWPATIIDLAVRGYVKIEAEDAETSEVNKKIARFITITSSIILVCFVALYKFNVYSIFISGFILLVIYITTNNILSNDYKIIKQKDFKEDSGLKPFEIGFLSALYSVVTKVFSTSRARSSSWISRTLFKRMRIVEKRFYEELSEEFTELYIVSIGVLKRRTIISQISGFIIGFIAIIGSDVVSSSHQSAKLSIIFFILSIAVSLKILVSFAFTNPVLSDKGREVKRKLLGFKMYLETAEKYRLRVLDEKTFSAFLPYAIVFKVEKKWAKKFESVSMDDPGWYSSYYGMHHLGSTRSLDAAGHSFSAVNFSNSFSSSFISAFSSSGASGSSGGGASGGGGSAGGGGGGGGGGAS